MPDDRDRTVQRQLIVIAEMRQANVSAETLRLYGRALRAYDTVDIQAAILHFRKYGREQGETAMPDLPTLEGVVKKYRAVRKQEERMEQECKDEAAYRAQAERDKAAGHDVSNPVDTDAALARITARMATESALKDGDAARRRETAERAREVDAEAKAERKQRVSSCAKCEYLASMSGDELRRLADLRDALAKQKTASAVESAEVAA